MTTLDDKIKSTLTPGTLIRFHNWAVGGFLFGIVTECEEEPYTHNKLHVWRPRATYSLDNIDAISVIKSMDDVPEYAGSDLQSFLCAAEEANIFYDFVAEHDDKCPETCPALVSYPKCYCMRVGL